MGSVEKSLSRKLRRMYEQLGPWRCEEAYTRAIFPIGEFAVNLFPYWMESEHRDFQLYLFHRCGFPLQAAGKIDLWATTVYEIPSLDVWLQLGWRRVAQAATRGVDEQRQMLFENGLNLLDLMAMIR